MPGSDIFVTFYTEGSRERIARLKKSVGKVVLKNVPPDLSTAAATVSVGPTIYILKYCISLPVLALYCT